MAYNYKVELMPSGSAIDTAWLDARGASKWQLVQVIPVTAVQPDGGGNIMCYFISGSA